MPVRLIALAPAIAMLLGAGAPAWGDPTDPSAQPSSATPSPPPPSPPQTALTPAELLDKARDDFRDAKYQDAATQSRSDQVAFGRIAVRQGKTRRLPDARVYASIPARRSAGS